MNENKTQPRKPWYKHALFKAVMIVLGAMILIYLVVLHTAIVKNYIKTYKEMELPSKICENLSKGVNYPSICTDLHVSNFPGIVFPKGTTKDVILQGMGGYSYSETSWPSNTCKENSKVTFTIHKGGLFSWGNYYEFYFCNDELQRINPYY